MTLTRQELEDNIVHAARKLAEDWSLETVDDIATALTCHEADSLADLFRSVEALQDTDGPFTLAGTLIECHTRGDEEGDDHFTTEEV